MNDQTSGLYLGLISGTSADGIDVALVRFWGESNLELIAGQTMAFPPEIRTEVLTLSQKAISVDLDRVGRLDHQLGHLFAQAANTLLQANGFTASDITAIGSHGQTLRHAPHGQAPFTWQIGDPNLIAERTGITTIADFRRRDVAAGGQGAPLMPAFHQAVLGSAENDVAVLNLGGIANLTLLPAQGQVVGFDTGPANGLMDAWISHCRGLAFDANGEFAASGHVIPALLEKLLSEPYFTLPFPKSTGRDLFHLEWLQSHLSNTAYSNEDVQATLLELTAQSVVDSLQRSQPNTGHVLVCGGGVHNRRLLARLSELLPGAQVTSIRSAGLDPDFVEAMGFAWLARQTILGLAGNLPAVTGAKGFRILGAIHPA